MKISPSIVATILFVLHVGKGETGTDAATLIQNKTTDGKSGNGTDITEAVFHVRRRRQGDGRAPSRPSKIPVAPRGSGTMAFALAESQINVMYEASKLNRLASNFLVGPIEWWIEEGREIYDRFNGWSTFTETTIVAKEDGVCHAVFGPGINPLDMWQNLNPFIERIEGSDCVVRRGFHESYYNSYYEEFRNDLETCLYSCPNQRHCQLAISGYSQGGAVAIVAAIDLRQYNPTTITFGGTQAILPSEGECADFNANNHYQLVVTLEGTYDGISVQPNPFFAKNYGHFMLLDEDPSMIGYPGFNVRDFVRLPLCYIQHLIGFYIIRLKNIRDRGNFPIPVGKWGAGHWCNYDDECDSGKCSRRLCQS